MNLVNNDKDYPLVFFMGVGSYDSEDESNVRFREELIHQQLILEIMGNNSEHLSDVPYHLS